MSLETNDIQGNDKKRTALPLYTRNKLVCDDVTEEALQQLSLMQTRYFVPLDLIGRPEATTCFGGAFSQGVIVLRNIKDIICIKSERKTSSYLVGCFQVQRKIQFKNE